MCYFSEFFFIPFENKKVSDLCVYNLVYQDYAYFLLGLKSWDVTDGTVPITYTIFNDTILDIFCFRTHKRINYSKPLLYDR